MKSLTLASLLATGAAALAQQATVTEFGTYAGAWPYQLKADQSARPVLGQTLTCALQQDFGVTVTLSCQSAFGTYAYGWSGTNTPCPSWTVPTPSFYAGGGYFWRPEATAALFLGVSDTQHESGLALPAALGVLDPAWAAAQWLVSTELGAYSAPFPGTISILGPVGTVQNTWSLPIPNATNLVGISLYGQALTRVYGQNLGTPVTLPPCWPVGAATMNFTNAVKWTTGTF